MGKPDVVVLDMKQAFDDFRRDINKMSTTNTSITANTVLQEVCDVILDNCEYWDKSRNAMFATANGIARCYLNQGDFGDRLGMYMAIVDFACRLREKIEQHNLEEYDECFYAVDKIHPRGIVVLKQWYSPGDR